MVGHIYIYLYGCVIPLVSQCAVYLCVYVCERHSKVILVLSYQGSTFIDPNVIKKNNLLNIAQFWEKIFKKLIIMNEPLLP